MSEVCLYSLGRLRRGLRGLRRRSSLRNRSLRNRSRLGRRPRYGLRNRRLLAERVIFIDNLLVRVHLIIEMSRPALRHGSLSSLFQVALYVPSYSVPTLL
jgi:hypothetical protein